MSVSKSQKVAIVTGASSGIGAATASLFARQGWRVYGTSRVAGNSGRPGVTSVRVDLADSGSIKEAVTRILAETGRIDALINNAGYSMIGAIEETGTDQAEALFGINFFGPVRFANAVLPTMRAQGSGRIVTVSSIVGLLPAPFMGFYAASKHAIEGWSESLDHEVRPFGIRATLIEPGFIKTNIGSNSDRVANPLPNYEAIRNRMLAGISAKVQGGADPDSVADAIFTAATAPAPKIRVLVGKDARLLARLRRFLPAGMMDKGMRKSFQLDAA
jgi:NAD(P)-dependent dehydrogenase (short-subunit alcohol dehydrogenase family)